MTRKLYGKGPSRWVKPYWTLRELDLAFEEVPISIMAGDTRKPAYLAINPYGKIPTYEDDDIRLSESAAICTYLADRHPEKGLTPKAGTKERAHYDQWVSFIISELEQPLWTMTRYAFMYAEEPHCEGAVATAKKEFQKIATVLETQVEDHLVGGRFSVADIMMAYTLKWATSTPITGEDLLEGFPKLRQYLTRMMARPAFPHHLFT